MAARTRSVAATGDGGAPAPASGTARDRFPRRHAATRRFSLGEPRNFVVTGDERRVLFLRSRSGSEPSTSLWAFDVASGTEQLVADPDHLLEGGPDGALLTEAEKRRRERARESAEGITSFAVDDRGGRACFALAGRLFVADLARGTVNALAAAGSVFDPRLDPSGTRVAYVSDRSLRVVARREPDRLLCGEAALDVTWGLAEFVAAEEMGRSRGFWWAPDGRRLAVCRVDNRPVRTFHIADPAHPERPPATHRYPQAGTANALVDLYVIGLDGSRVRVRWDRRRFPYLASVSWQAGHPLTLVVQTRDQRTVDVLVADDVTGATRRVHRDSDEHWVELVAGAPRWLGDELVTVTDRGPARSVVVGDRVLTPPELQVRAVVGTQGSDLLVTASTEPTELHLHRVGLDGTCTRLTDGPGVHGGTGSGSVLVVVSRSMARFGSVAEVRVAGRRVATLASLAERPTLNPRGSFHVIGERRLRTALLLPRRRGLTPPFPVLLDPYGGPHAQRVLRSRNDLLVPQWFADQGFAVVVADGRGTPGRGPAWERAVWGDLAGPVLDDQVDALQGLARVDERLDLSRVGIRGWSFGGYLAALAVLRRPDVFGAAVAGAPVTEWRLYDTHYTERYLGHPDGYPEHYERTSLLNDAASLQRPLLLIHGMVDDNVVVAHTLQLSSALLAAGRPHSVLPLSGVTHMTPQEVVAENLLRLQVAFLRSSLGMADRA
jgi:dipeptidyl-peptidase-4